MQIKGWIVNYGLNFIGALLIFFIGKIVVGYIRKFLEKLLKKSKTDPTLVSFISNLAYVGLLVVVIIATLNKLGVQTTSLVAVIGAAGLAVGLALQGSLSNFAAGVLLIIQKPFQVGDYIQGAGTSGTVEHISIFSTQLKTPDNRKVVAPNSKLINDNITNFTANETRRLDMVVGVSYSDDLDKVKKTLWQILEEDERILEEPKPTVGVTELADSSINFVVRPWVKTSDYWALHYDLHEKVKKRFDQENISIPFPQQDIHLHQ
jgi:small conductance mechanosensitive channel